MGIDRDRVLFNSAVRTKLRFLETELGFRRKENSFADEILLTYKRGDLGVSASLSYPGLPFVTLRKDGLQRTVRYSFAKHKKTNNLQKRYYRHIEGRHKLPGDEFKRVEDQLLTALAGSIRTAVDKLSKESARLPQGSWIKSGERG